MVVGRTFWDKPEISFRIIDFNIRFLRKQVKLFFFKRMRFKHFRIKTKLKKKLKIKREQKILLFAASDLRLLSQALCPPSRGLDLGILK